MQELVIKMAICLIIALALGFLFGWLVKRAFAKNHYETELDELQAKLAQSKSELRAVEGESSLLKEQLITAQDNLENSSHTTIELQEQLSSFQAKYSMLESNIKDRETLIQKEKDEKNVLKKALDEKHQELEKTVSQSTNQEEIINRIKEHHTLLKDEVTKLTNENNELKVKQDELSIMIGNFKVNDKKLQDEKMTQEVKVKELLASLNKKDMETTQLQNKVQEANKLHLIINEYKDKEKKLLDEKRAKEDKIKELESILNEKKMATIELHNKVKEIDNLKQKNTLLSQEIKQIQAEVKTDKNSAEGFNFVKFAKKALYYVPETSEEITKNADKVIKEYKNRK